MIEIIKVSDPKKACWDIEALNRPHLLVRAPFKVLSAMDYTNGLVEDQQIRTLLTEELTEILNSHYGSDDLWYIAPFLGHVKDHMNRVLITFFDVYTVDDAWLVTAKIMNASGFVSRHLVTLQLRS